MPKHKSEKVTLGEIVLAMNGADQWWEIMGIDIPDYNKESSSQDFFAKEIRYIDEHRDDLYLVSWPDHVINPRYNSDASYQPILPDQEITESVYHNGSMYHFGEGGFTVRLQRSPSEMQLVIRGLIASSPQDAVKQARHYYGLAFTELHNIQVYRGNDGWYDKSECIFEEHDCKN